MGLPSAPSGFFAQLLYEAIGRSTRNQVRGVTATGRPPLWRVMGLRHRAANHAAFAEHQRLPRDINIGIHRAGLVGAGGIGLQLQSSLQHAWPGPGDAI